MNFSLMRLMEIFFRLSFETFIWYTGSSESELQTQEHAKSTLDLSQEYPNFSVQQIVGTNLLSRFPDVDKITTSLMWHHAAWFMLNDPLLTQSTLIFCKRIGYIDAGDGRWRRNVLPTTSRCWWRFWVKTFDHFRLQHPKIQKMSPISKN